MHLTNEAFQLFDREIYTFQQLKKTYSLEEIEKIKQEYKEHWQEWKKLQQEVSQLLPPEYQLAKPKVESWTNGWNLRSHFWSAYRNPDHKNKNTCLAVLLNKKQFQVYLMFQHYKSEERSGKVEEYNKLLDLVKSWSKKIAIDDYYIWPQSEDELADHLPLARFLADPLQPETMKKEIEGSSFQIGKLVFVSPDLSDTEIVTQTVQTIKELAPLYFALDQTLNIWDEQAMKFSTN